MAVIEHHEHLADRAAMLAIRGLASQISSRAKAVTFVPDYRLAPGTSFPAAFDDAVLALLAAGVTQARAVAAAVFSPGIDPRANAMSGDLSALPPVRIVWKSMTHVFPSSVAMLTAAREALDAVGDFRETSFQTPGRAGRGEPG